MLKRFLLALSIGSAVAAAVPASSAELVVKGGWLFDGVSGRIVRNWAIVISNGRFLTVNVDPAKSASPGAQVLTLTGDDYILPGMLDLHAHYNMTLNKIRREEVQAMPVIYLANGVTTTYTAGSFDPRLMLETRRSIDRGERIGPRILNSGPYFGPARPGWNAEATAAEIREEVDHWAELGVAGFKAKRISADHLRTLIERAHQHGLTVTGHLDSGYNDTVNPRDAISMGIDRVEHFLGGDVLDADRPAYDSFGDVRPGTPEFERIVELFLRHRVYFDATLTAYGYFGDRKRGYDYWVDERKFFTPFARELTADRRQSNERFGKIFEIKLRTIKAFYDAGGGNLITLGTDHNSAGEYLPGFSAHRELHALVLAGIPPASALRIATINGARAMGLSDRLGTIEAGKLADMFVIKGNPLEQIRNTRSVHTVIKNGVVYDTGELLRSVEGRVGPEGPEELDSW